jgi:hypothetical protein
VSVSVSVSVVVSEFGGNCIVDDSATTTLTLTLTLTS